ncbi:MAG TPA: general secretion pathway protein GspB [Candidatus Omnitrophota bacterium]|mgnify:CR=1 FL=1|nr:general secretion pathway protein GspB [Candidatus Omnitrophota bacterium]
MSIIQEALKKVEPSKAGSAVPVRIADDKPLAAELKKITQPKIDLPFAKEYRKKRRTNLYIAISAAALIVACAGAAYFFMYGKPPSLPVTQIRDEKTAPLPDSSIADRQDTIYRNAGDEYSKYKDSAEPNSVVRAEPPDLALNGIMYLETGSRAIINNKIVQEGDMVGGATVVLINKNSAILKYNDVEITLSLK